MVKHFGLLAGACGYEMCWPAVSMRNLLLHRTYIAVISLPIY